MESKIKQNKTTVKTYGLIVKQKKSFIRLSVEANDSNHAQAQAEDICRALQADGFQLTYELAKETLLSRFFKKLAFNDFNYKSCEFWAGSESNKNPCFYIFKKRFYVRSVILRYLDIPKDDSQVKLTCRCSNCINPYHFSYYSHSNSKLTEGDLKLLHAYAREGVKISQIAELLNVHKATVYRQLKKDKLCVR
jgi:hypothetical protein